MALAAAECAVVVGVETTPAHLRLPLGRRHLALLPLALIMGHIAMVRHAGVHGGPEDHPALTMVPTKGHHTIITALALARLAAAA